MTPEKLESWLKIPFINLTATGLVVILLLVAFGKLVPDFVTNFFRGIATEFIEGFRKANVRARINLTGLFLAFIISFPLVVPTILEQFGLQIGGTHSNPLLSGTIVVSIMLFGAISSLTIK